MGPAEIVVVGSYNHDVVLSVAHLPAPGETCLALGRRTSPGGKGSNQAVQAARCSARVAMLAAIGCDPAGDEALDVWAGAGIEAAASPRLADHGTGIAMILVDAKGENRIVVDPGANAHLTPSHIDQAAALIRSAKLVLAQLETPVTATRRAFEIARQAGVLTALNAAPAPDAIDAELIALTDILFVNEIEAGALAGGADPAEAGAALLARVGQAVIITLGKEGAVLFHRGQPRRAHPAHSIDAVDTTGAGDAFIGAFVAHLVKSGSFDQAMAWGLAAGALACTAMGAVTSFAPENRIAGLLAPQA
ncbi:MAG: PfkB protein [Phenylobacterium sp.]|nr:PfkB protein [Phenylobacterium sp.]